MTVSVSSAFVVDAAHMESRKLTAVLLGVAYVLAALKAHCEVKLGVAAARRSASLEKLGMAAIFEKNRVQRLTIKK